MHRDGVQLHAGNAPTGDLERIRHKMAFLVASGVAERDAQMAMLAASRFTVGSVLESAACWRSKLTPAQVRYLPPGIPTIDHESAFEAGLALILAGLGNSSRPDRPHSR
jgi:TetR/AcrR family tetracycline transcriptional repressor